MGWGGGWGGGVGGWGGGGMTHSAPYFLFRRNCGKRGENLFFHRYPVWTRLRDANMLHLYRMPDVC